MYPGRPLDFCRKCLPGADPNAFGKEVLPVLMRVSPVISMVGAQGLRTLDPLIKSSAALVAWNGTSTQEILAARA